MNELLEQILEECAHYTKEGKLADYIPELTKANPDDFGIFIISGDKRVSKAGDFRKELPNARIYVYNNNSVDKTAEIAKSAGAIVVNEYKQGKGNVVSSQSANRAGGKSKGIQISMSRKGTPLDNAVIESFHSRLKNEVMYNKEFIIKNTYYNV